MTNLEHTRVSQLFLVMKHTSSVLRQEPSFSFPNGQESILHRSMARQPINIGMTVGVRQRKLHLTLESILLLKQLRIEANFKTSEWTIIIIMCHAVIKPDLKLILFKIKGRSILIHVR